MHEVVTPIFPGFENFPNLPCVMGQFVMLLLQYSKAV